MAKVPGRRLVKGRVRSTEPRKNAQEDSIRGCFTAGHTSLGLC